MGWQNLIGTPKQYAGTSGTVTMNSGEVVLFVSAYGTTGSPTVSILGGPSIAIPIGTVGIWFVIFEHTLMVAGNGTSSANTIVFTGTTHYYVHTVHQGTAAA